VGKLINFGGITMSEVLTDVEGEKFNRIEYGNDVDDHVYDGDTCGDCGVTEGENHKEKCDMERCPKCGGQFISCDCIFVEQQEKWSSWTGKKHLTHPRRELIKKQEINYDE
jgi:hypothetical protein